LNKRREYRRYDSSSGRGGHRPSLSFSGPLKYDKYGAANDKKSLDQHKPDYSEDKLKAPKQYRRARGLCDTCPKKWSYGHKCTPTIQLHVVQEMWELCSEDESG
jgi:hypothetical protein